MSNMSPIYRYKVGEFRVTHEMDLGDDKVHVTIDGFQKPIFTFDHSGYMFDRNDKQIGRISLDRERRTFFRSSDEVVSILGESIDVVETYLRLERAVVKHYLETEKETFEQLLEVQKKLK